MGFLIAKRRLGEYMGDRVAIFAYNDLDMVWQRIERQLYLCLDASGQEAANKNKGRRE